MAFTRYHAGRTLQSLIVLLMSSVIVFALVRMTPGNPAQLLLGPMADARAAAGDNEGARPRSAHRHSVFRLDSAPGARRPGYFADDEAAGGGADRRSVQADAVVARGCHDRRRRRRCWTGTWRRDRSRWVANVRLSARVMSILYGAPAVWVGLVAILVFAMRSWLPPAGFEDPLRIRWRVSRLCCCRCWWWASQLGNRSTFRAQRPR